VLVEIIPAFELIKIAWYCIEYRPNIETYYLLYLKNIYFYVMLKPDSFEGSLLPKPKID
jgi:hypothetical protein